ncbi:hypothetical protein jhhlp_001715 [Lomentospora prolificans]|uniref:LITAF domain-containing protein n=1 Tax=Lomentospora prolificans TaxID=41688 RepID=A0A2N3NH37_9PEZI|nr:hypothetical protein jhhlp_001715 [Lomentospora prolificans]
MATTPIPVSRLNTEPEVIRCPACQHVGKTIRVMDMISDARGAGNAAMGIIGCLFCNCSAMMAPTYYSIAHYCSNCGIRLVAVPWQEDPIPQLDNSFLVDDGKGTKVAPSPFGPPPEVNEAQVRNFAERYSTTAPSSVYEIKLEGSIKLPTAALDAAGSRIIFQVEWPGFHAARGSPFSPVEYAPAEAMTAEPKPATTKSMMAWNPNQSTPHIRVSVFGSPCREIATAQVFGDTRDFILHTPTEDHKGGVHYASRRSGVTNKHSPSAGHMVWNSCAGPLTWTLRKVRDRDMPKQQRCIVLLDAYDRLAAVIKASELKTEEKDYSGFQLRLYGDISEQLVGEIIASFSAVCYVIWNYNRLGVPDIGLDLAATGLAVAVTGMELASVVG